jgi:hypothetical protein
MSTYFFDWVTKAMYSAADGVIRDKFRNFEIVSAGLAL